MRKPRLGLVDIASATHRMDSLQQQWNVYRPLAYNGSFTTPDGLDSVQSGSETCMGIIGSRNRSSGLRQKCQLCWRVNRYPLPSEKSS